MKLKYDEYELDAISSLVFRLNHTMCEYNGYTTIEHVRDMIKENMIDWAKNAVANNDEFVMWSTGGFQIVFSMTEDREYIVATIGLCATIMADEIDTYGKTEIEL